MVYMYDVFMNFLKLESFGWMDFQWRDRNHSVFYKNISVCVSKMNQSQSSLKQQEGE